MDFFASLNPQNIAIFDIYMHSPVLQPLKFFDNLLHHSGGDFLCESVLFGKLFDVLGVQFAHQSSVLLGAVAPNPLLPGELDEPLAPRVIFILSSPMRYPTIPPPMAARM